MVEEYCDRKQINFHTERNSKTGIFNKKKWMINDFEINDLKWLQLWYTISDNCIWE